VSAPELSPVPREARPYQGETAGVVTRSVANVIDALVVGVIVGGCYLGLVSVKFLLDPRTFEWPEGRFLLGLTFTLLVAVGYLWLSWWLLGRSYGKHVMGIRVSGRRGRKLGPVRALARAAFCVFFPIGFFWCVISPRRHSIQDIAVFSTVTYDWMPHPVAPGAPVVEAPRTESESEPEPAPEPAAEPTVTQAAPDPEPKTRRYRWARAIDPYDG
jgi:uncharacterized RDD family membrane protein YckC